MQENSTSSPEARFDEVKTLQLASEVRAFLRARANIYEAEAACGVARELLSREAEAHRSVRIGPSDQGLQQTRFPLLVVDENRPT